MTNSVDPNQIAPEGVVSDQRLHCLQSHQEVLGKSISKTELQIRRDNRDNLGITTHISSLKHKL